ncbi:MAG TPA: YbaB/EbfC family nucleoid-associated protein [bacterium]|nr:YbaB/EbfC family nucleoid-associated protein [Patescibacteria group bacterium]HOC96377.1 YbaB/EbfC family nucleoid-associated protein [bacterium]HPO11099.1 YbaB/EbfC family nucleoid-associated protein [bacterium]
MSMFSQLKQIKDLKEQAKKLQDELGKEIIDTEKDGIKISMNGAQEVLKVEITDITILQDKEKVEQAIKDCTNESIKKVQNIMAKKMQSMPDLNLPNLN